MTDTLRARKPNIASASAEPGQAEGFLRAPLMGPGRTVVELLLAGGWAAVLSLAIQFAINRLPRLVPGTHVPAAMVALSSAVIIAVAFGSLAVPRVRAWPVWVKLAGAWSALSALVTVIVALPLMSTRFFLGGASVDNSFRLRYMERMASDWALNDINYYDVPPYYPGGWFWLGGRFANLFGLSGWEAYKPFSIMTAAVTAAVTFVLWSLVVRRRTALLASVVTLVAGLQSSSVEEPYAWPTTSWLPPVMILAWLALRRREAAKWPLVLVGVYLGICAMTYTLHLGFGALLVVGLALVAGVLAVRAGERRGVVVRRMVGRLVLIGAISAAMLLVVWAPFLFAGGLGAENVAARFLPSGSAYFPIPFKPDGIFGALCLAGLVWSIVRARRNTVAFVLLAITAGVYVWFALSMLALTMETTLLAFRFVVTLNVTLAVGGLFAALELLRLLVRTWSQWRRPALAVSMVLAIASCLSLVQDGVRYSMAEIIERANTDFYPDGTTASGGGDPADDAAWTDELIATIDRLGTGEPTREILLSDQLHMMSFRPYWGFHDLTPHYSNPLSRYTERADEIRSWARSTSPEQLYERMHDGPFEPATMFVLRRADDGSLRYTIKYDTFPERIPVKGRPVSFDAALFDSPRFERRDVGPFAVIAVR
ncbi:arabinofuranosyltransferase [Prauserella oleivorans]|uniref:Galactan 5-O-arabinofuranosyltransferase n=1 Tax=Prauserella oleivorans TaxID=1478153 RepID=A0ABW5WKP6_9PSEU